MLKDELDEVKRELGQSLELTQDFLSLRTVLEKLMQGPSHVVHKGIFMTKVDGMKVYIFCYSSCYIVTLSDRNLTVVSCTFPRVNQPIIEITGKPDVMVAEMMMDGRMVYIDTLARDGSVLPNTRMYRRRPMSTCMYPDMIIRRSWSTIPTEGMLNSSSLPSDGLICVTTFRSLRLKKPTIDLRCVNRSLCSMEKMTLVPITEADTEMQEGMIYELSVDNLPDINAVMLTNPIERRSKGAPNSMDIVRRAVISVRSDTGMDTMLFDITSMSFSMRSRVYEMAQSNASSSKRVIITFGCGRLQEWRQMKISSFSYIAVDPEIDLSRFSKGMSRARVLPYDMNRSLLVNISSISRSPGTVLYCKCRSEDFVMNTTSCPRRVYLRCSRSKRRQHYPRVSVSRPPSQSRTVLSFEAVS
jgi:hypothetical protein